MDRRDSTDSQDTFISLEQLDPSPIDTPPDELELEKQLPDTPPPPSLGRSHTLGLSGVGGGGHSYVYYCITSLPKRFPGTMLLIWE
jgi:hypothetical protein